MISQHSLRQLICKLSLQLSSKSHRLSPQCQSGFFTYHQKFIHRRLFSTEASSSQILANGGEIDDKARPMVNWMDACKKICWLRNSKLGAESVLNRFQRGEKKLTRRELRRLINELSKYKRYRSALEVSEWMNSRNKGRHLTTTDIAVQLGLIAKVRGISAAEGFFQTIPEQSKDGRVYGELLSCYAQSKMVENAESLIETMKKKRNFTEAYPFNVIMTHYMNLKQYDKVEAMIAEMIKKNVRLDLYTYNIWLTSCGSHGSAEKMEQVFERMQHEKGIIPNWTTFCNLATMYIKFGEIEKANDRLKKAESRIRGRDRMPYHYLLTLYGRCRNKEEVFRVWNTYKAAFSRIPSVAYHSIMSSLLRIGDVEGAEQINEEWRLTKPKCDIRIPNLLIGFYAKQGDMENAERILKQITDMGGKPSSYTWEILAEGHIVSRKPREAFSYLEKSFAGDLRRWKLKQQTYSSFIALCEEESELVCKDGLLDLCRNAGYSYGSYLDGEGSPCLDTD